MTAQRAPRRCGDPAPGNIGRCTLTHGHTGQHWNAGGEWGQRKRPSRCQGHVPGTMADVRELQRNVRELAIQLTREGVELR